ncbi:hypothetical protein GWK47_019941 [Chionoecetes opilio]|uniref:Uncharacterized protein n=1 Tax=Chionoecetes opilio TaxID=41210 RepID=A0A8J4XQ96_CHIOP|nr:hypothetical protein GWK47_019941 [Chionoecetes opilio]
MLIFVFVQSQPPRRPLHGATVTLSAGPSKEKGDRLQAQFLIVPPQKKRPLVSLPLHTCASGAAQLVQLVQWLFAMNGVNTLDVIRRHSVFSFKDEDVKDGVWRTVGKAYVGLTNLGYTHRVVNHTKSFGWIQ